MNNGIRILATVALGWSTLATAQNTVGTTLFEPENVFEGHTLIYPHNQPHVYLINFCGEVVHQWNSPAESRPGNTAYLLPNGDLILTRRPASIAGNPIWAGGGGATIERRSWDNDLIWSYTQNDDSARFHHDVAPMPNGNVLAICWEAIGVEEALAAGADSTALTSSGLWSEKVVELAPDGSGGANVVWEWRMWDHLVQDFDPTANNFGVIAEAPQKVNINYPEVSNVPPDFVHMNSIDYNPLNDHILLSAPAYDEIWVIDHGPFSNGEIKWRWGNPAAYGIDDSTQHHLHYQHDANWVDAPYQVGSPFLGKISVFNNRVPDDNGAHSALTVVAPPYVEYENAYVIQDGVFAPEVPDFYWEATDAGSFYSSGLSSFQPLAGPRFLVCDGRAGRTSEITLTGDTIWQYVTPLQAGQPVAQGTQLLPADNMTFRATRYPLSYPAFNNLDSAAFGPAIELDPVPLPACLPCDLTASLSTDESGQFLLETTGGTEPFEVIWTNVGNGASCAEWSPTVVNCPELYVATDGGVVVEAIVTDANGCTAVGNASWTGLHELHHAVRLWPNPARDALHVAGVPSGTALRLLDLNGRLAAQHVSSSGILTHWSLPPLEPGTYLILGTAEPQLVFIQPQ